MEKHSTKKIGRDIMPTRRENMSKKAYLGLDWIVSLILAIIPITSIILGIVTRVQRENLIGAILNFFLCPIFWIIDLITMIVHKDLTILA
jgi:hypothetical protein